MFFAACRQIRPGPSVIRFDFSRKHVWSYVFDQKESYFRSFNLLLRKNKITVLTISIRCTETVPFVWSRVDYWTFFSQTKLFYTRTLTFWEQKYKEYWKTQENCVNVTIVSITCQYYLQFFIDLFVATARAFVGIHTITIGLGHLNN